ncbi:unnamed protein product [Sphagnum troendelagicum]
MSSNDHMDEFFDENGYFGNIDKLYKSSYDRIAKKVHEYFPSITEIRLAYDDVVSSEECVLTKKTRMVPMYGYIGRTQYLLMNIPYPTKKCYFIVDGIEWAIISLDVSYSTMVKVLSPPADEVGKIRWIAYMRTEAYESDYKETRVFMTEENEVRLNVSTMFTRLGQSQIKSMVKRCVNPYVVYKILMEDSGTPEEFEQHIRRWLMSDNRRYEDYITPIFEPFNQGNNGGSIDQCKSSARLTLDELISKDVPEDKAKSGSVKARTSKAKKLAFDEAWEILVGISSEDFLASSLRNKYQKVEMLAYMIAKLIERTVGPPCDDERDKLIYKKVDAPSFMIERTIVNELHRLKITIDKDNGQDGVATKIENSINRVVTTSLKTRRLQSYYSVSEDTHMQILGKRSELDIFCHVRRLRANTGSENTNMSVRQLAPDRFGFECFAETNEGVESGLNKYLALTAIISDELPNDLVTELLSKHVEGYSSDKFMRYSREAKYSIFLNGFFVGKSTTNLKEHIRSVRREHPSYRDVSVCTFGDSEFHVYVYTDKGRLVRPFLRKFPTSTVSSGSTSTVSSGSGSGSRASSSRDYIEYLDQFEVNDPDHKITLHNDNKPNCTHKEINNLTMFGLSASMMPFPEHNQAARLTFESSMAKQALCYDPEFRRIITDDVRTLIYGHDEIVGTSMSRRFNQGKRKTGSNIVIAVLPGGYNMDDGLIFKKEAIDRGLFNNIKRRYQRVEVNSTTMIPARTDASRIGNRDIYYGNGIVRYDLKPYRYSKTGIINKNAFIGKTGHVGTYLEENVDLMSDAAKKVKNTFHRDMRVKNVIERKLDSTTFYNIVAESCTVPGVGDKFASRYSQKGVISKVTGRADLPYTESGLVPDILINPHSIPSRMTIGHLLEMIMGKLVASGIDPIKYGEEYYDASPFRGIDYGELIHELQKSGFEIKEAMYNPHTGEKMEGKVYIGVCHYMALKHYVEDKMFYRTQGPIKYLTRQPTEGKSEGGGLRMGEMDFDALTSHNAGKTIITKSKDNVDEITIYICDNCNSTLNSPDDSCAFCMSKNLVQTTIPNGLRMTMHYMNAAGINTKMFTKEIMDEGSDDEF